MKPAGFPAVYRAMLAHEEPAELDAVRVASNPYKRGSLRAAFDAGWYAFRHRVALGSGWTSPHMSSLGSRAFRRGFEARMQVQPSIEQEV